MLEVAPEITASEIEQLAIQVLSMCTFARCEVARVAPELMEGELGEILQEPIDRMLRCSGQQASDEEVWLGPLYAFRHLATALAWKHHEEIVVTAVREGRLSAKSLEAWRAGRREVFAAALTELREHLAVHEAQARARVLEGEMDAEILLQHRAANRLCLAMLKGCLWAHRLGARWVAEAVVEVMSLLTLRYQLAE